MEKIFEFGFSQTEEDIIKINRTLMKKKTAPIIAAIALFGTAGIIFAFFAFVSLIGGSAAEDVIFPFFMAYFLILFACLYYPLCIWSQKSAVRQMLKNDKSQLDYYTVTLYDECYCEKSGLIEAKVNYGAFQELTVTPDIMILMLNPAVCYAFPRRLFDDNTWNWLYNFLMTKCSQYNVKYKIYNN